ncbi:putative phospholipase B-like 2 isoform X2 [Eurytemora carolleeae]|uniref:putative phospholipase B-like 2 isoform X2 n=1 Tax=Eurytemora carolleeae TaxID=1294199 RepID=UPI000C78463C|nr:putative phospholipase B-like 2 isoform X2 [Eurytemora carolleeae]|eukprot:XP_023343300.1 putative phospholipase B-like 2 isoform X2 [Eurytemora affinis]
MIIFFILLLPGCFGFEDVKSIKARLDINKDGSYSIVEIQDKIEGSNSLATAEYKNAINQTGWAFLDISTSQKFTDKKQWLDESLKWTESKIKQSSHRKGYWHHVSLFMTQLTGIAEGYHHVMKDKNKTITLKDIIVMNVFGDLEDLESALNPTQLPNKVLGSYLTSNIKQTYRLI